MTDAQERVVLESPDLAAQARSALTQLFPGVLQDGVLDATKLGELLGVDVTAPADGRERYGLMWAGKTEAVRSLQTPSKATLVPDLKRSVDWDTAQNVFIEGDNLEVLKLLQKAYNDKVKLIYIDPPYNTGNEFIYNDDFSDGLRGYLEYTGQLDTEGDRKSTDSDARGGRKHSRWLTMLHPRLVLARTLLTQDGILAVSIDDNEVAALRLLLDEVFGPENFLGTFVWVSNIKGRQISGAGPAGTKEYLHVYARDIDNVGAFRGSATFLKKLMPTVYKGFNYQTKHDERGPYVVKNELYNTNSAFNELTRPSLVFDIYFNPITRAVRTEPVSDNGHVHDGFVKIGPKRNNNGVHKYHAFRWSRGKVESESYDLEFVEAPGGWKVSTKVRDVDSTSVKDIFMDISTNAGSDDIAAVGINPRWFDYPKPVELIRVLVSFATSGNDLVLDFFAGSGTTAHAVAAQNAADNGQRRTLSINLPEPVDPKSEAGKAGLRTVADVSYARINQVVNSIPGAEAQGLRVLELSNSNFVHADATSEQLELQWSTLKEPTPEIESLAAEVLLKEGIPIDVPWIRGTAGSAPLIIAGKVAVVLTLDVDNEVVTAAIALKPEVLVFLEDGFAGRDAVKANAATRAKQLGIRMKTV